MDYTIAQTAQKTKLTAYTLRYYEKEGLLQDIKRDKSGNRIFTNEDLEVIFLICCLKETGMPIREIRQFIDCQSQGDFTLHERNDMLIRHKKAVIKQIAGLQRHLKIIDHKLMYYHDACEAFDEGRPVPPCRSCPTRDSE